MTGICHIAAEDYQWLKNGMWYEGALPLTSSRAERRRRMSVGRKRLVIGIGLLAATLSAALPVSQARGGWLRTPARIFAGNATTAYRDPAALWADGVCHLFFTLVETERDGGVYSYVAMSTSRDLLHWKPVTKLTPRCDRDYSSPGNVVRDGDEWVLCFQSYPRPEPEGDFDRNASISVVVAEKINDFLDR